MMHYLFILTLVALVSFSCKKEKKDEQAGANQLSTNGGQKSADTAWYGWLAVQREFQINPSGIVQVNTGYTTSHAFFTDQPATNLQIANVQPATNLNYVEVDGVILNTISFKDDFGSYFYIDTTNGSFSAPHHWKVDGKGLIPDIDYIHWAMYPSYQGYANLPDTIYKSTSFTIELNGLQNCNTVILSLAGGYKAVEVNGTSAEITFPVSELTLLPPFNSVELRLTFVNNNGQLFNGKSFNFITSTHYFKDIRVLP
jgi:hypothetical protein